MTKPRMISRFRLLGLLLAVMLAVACAGPPPPIPIDDIDKARRGPYLEKMAARIYDGDELQSVVEAQTAQVDLDANETDLHGVRLSFYSDSEWTGAITSDHGVMYLDDKPDGTFGKYDIHLEGEVVYTDKNGNRIRTPELTYFSATGKIVSGGGRFDQEVSAGDGRTMVMTGSYFETDRNLTNFVGHETRMQFR